MLTWSGMFGVVRVGEGVGDGESEAEGEAESEAAAPTVGRRSLFGEGEGEGEEAGDPAGETGEETAEKTGQEAGEDASTEERRPLFGSTPRPGRTTLLTDVARIARLAGLAFDVQKDARARR